MQESLTTLVDSLFLNALRDPLMTEPGNAVPLFDPSIVSLQLGGDASMMQGGDAVSLPLQKIYLTVGVPITSEQFFIGNDDQNQPVTLSEESVEFTVWTSEMTSQDDLRQRLLFARDRRSYVFSKYGLELLSRSMTRAVGASQATSLFRTTYHWWFRYTRGSSV